MTYFPTYSLRPFGALLVCITVILSVLQIYREWSNHALNIASEKSIPLPLIRPLKNRWEIGSYLNELGYKVGAELGVQRGLFAEATLKDWYSCEKYYLIDIWDQQENYDDGANVETTVQESIFQDAQNRLEPFSSKTVFLRKFTSEAAKDIPDNELDYVYVDARHDYCGCLQDMELYWPKLKAGGLLAGHDYHSSDEVGGAFKTCADGSIHPGSVKGAVLHFVERHNLQVVITYREDAWHTWMIRKPFD